MSDVSLEKRIKLLEDRFEKLNEYLSKSGEISIDTVIRHAALEKLMIEKGIVSEIEVQDRVRDSLKEVVDKANEVFNAG